MDILLFAVLSLMVFGNVNSQGRVGAPTFTLSSSAPNSFVIQFTPMSVSEWRIQYRETGLKKKQLEIDGSLTEYTVGGLAANTEYKVRVMGTSPGVKGKYSDWFGVRTTSDAPQPQPEPEATATVPERPSNIAIDPQDTTARLTWEPPIDNGGEMIGYVVSYGTSDNPRENVFTLRPQPTYLDLDGLTPNTRYEISITSYNSHGQSYPASLEFQTTGGVVEEPVVEEPVVEEPVEEVVRGPPPQPENVRYESISPTVVQVTWTLPQTTAEDEIENVRFGFGDEGTQVEYLPSSNLGMGATSYYAEQLRPGSRYTVMVLTENRNGQSEPVVLTVETIPIPVPVTPDAGTLQQAFVPAPTQVTAEVVSPTTVRITFIDPSLGQTQDTSNQRHYALRYKRDSDPQFQVLTFRETTYLLEYLTPETNYQIEVATVLSQSVESVYTTVYVYTVDLSRDDLVRDVTAIQVKVTNPGLLSAVINWIPPHNQRDQIRGFVVEYTAGEFVTPSNTWERIDVSSRVPSATVQPLIANTTYHVRVAPRFGNQMGDFSSPPQLFLTPTVPPSGQPVHVCSSTETQEQVIARVQWMRDGGGPVSRPALVGVPLPYCDDYYGIHECHGLVCFCIPGKRPQSDAACRSGGYQGDQPLPGYQGDQPIPESLTSDTPCRVEYEAGRRQMANARKAGKTLYGVNLPYCTDDGHYYLKQCVGSVCFCSSWDGEHIGKEVPIWEAASLDC